MDYCWLAYKNRIFPACQGHDWSIKSSKKDHQYGCVLPRIFKVYFHGLRLAIYIKVLVFAVLLLRYQKKLLTTCHPQIDGESERQNSILEVYLKAFVNWK